MPLATKTRGGWNPGRLPPGLKCFNLALLVMYAQGTETKSKLYKVVWMFIKTSFRLSDVPLSLSSCHYVHSIFIYLHYHMAFHVWNFFFITQNTFFNPQSSLPNPLHFESHPFQDPAPPLLKTADSGNRWRVQEFKY